jgi:hypothetical protein
MKLFIQQIAKYQLHKYAYVVSLKNKICTYQVRSRKLNVPGKLTEWKICIGFHFLEINPLHIRSYWKKNMHAHLALGTGG